MRRRQANGHAAADVSSADYGYDARGSEFDEDDATASDSPADRDRFVDLDFDSDVDEEIALPGLCARTRPVRRRSGAAC